ncbi:MAG: hypothetical protein GY756_18060 [bacterium]|nr:hypothetical protein [bacterium]
MRKYFLILILLKLIVFNSSAQCLCGDVRFKIKMPDLKIENNDAKSLINIAYPEGIFYNKEEMKVNYNLDTLNIRYPTGGGIVKITFEIKNYTTNEVMSITFLNMIHDSYYNIDLTSFQPGHFIFDWLEICRCQLNNPSKGITDCNDKEFYTFDFKGSNEYYVYTNLKLLNLEMYRIEQPTVDNENH